MRSVWKPVLLTVLLTFITLTVPWRLVTLYVMVVTTRPGYVQMPEDNARYWDCRELEGQLDAWGWDVSYNSEMEAHGVYGLTNTDEHTVKIASQLHWTARYFVLLHEAAHTLQPVWLNREEEEVFAESVAAIASHDGHMREHARYLAHHKTAFILVAITAWHDIVRVADLLQAR